jgi:predicted cytidylate kinase
MAKITISGYAGTGKSTVGKMLAEKLGCKFLSVGGIAREIAEKEFGITINEFQAKCEENPSLDKRINYEFGDICNSANNVVADFRLGFHFVKNSFNVLFTLSEEEAAKRLLQANRKMEDTDPKSVRKRNEDMRRRFIERFGVDFADEKNFNLVIDTDGKTPENIASLILAAAGYYTQNLIKEEI